MWPNITANSAPQTLKYRGITWGSHSNAESVQQIWGEGLRFRISNKLPSEATANPDHGPTDLEKCLAFQAVR